MKKNILINRALRFSVCGLFMILTLISFRSFAQTDTTVIYENFNTYIGTAATVPVGWYFKYVGGSGYYATASSSGPVSGPNSFKFGGSASDSLIVTPRFIIADSVSFWIKGNSTDTVSNLNLYESADSINWTKIVKIRPIIKGALGYHVDTTARYLKFVYVKSKGNVAFDDFRLSKYIPHPVSCFSANNVCLGDTTCFMDCSVISGGVGTIASWFWDFGDGRTSTAQHPCNLYANSGTYFVKLVVTGSDGNKDSLTKIVNCNPFPMPGFVTTEIVPPVITFSNTTGISMGSTSFWSWDFGDGSATDANVNPVHTFPALGKYKVCLTAVSDQGCSAKKCDSMSVTNVGIKNFEVSNEYVFYPNPSKGLVTIDYLYPSNKNIADDLKLVNVRDVNGKEVPAVKSGKNSSGKYAIDLSSMPSGIYILNLKTRNNEIISKQISISK